MEILRYLTYGIALFFAGSWPFGLWMRPDFRLKNTVVAVAFWWLHIVSAVAGWISPFHLWWLMPFTLATSATLMGSMLRRVGHVSAFSLGVMSGVPIALFWLLAWATS